MLPLFDSSIDLILSRDNFQFIDSVTIGNLITEHLQVHFKSFAKFLSNNKNVQKSDLASVSIGHGNPGIYGWSGSTNELAKPP